MNRTGLIVALVIAVVVGVALAVFPQLDVGIAALFYNPATHAFAAWYSDRVEHALRDGLVGYDAAISGRVGDLVGRVENQTESLVVRIGDTMSLVATVAGPGREGLDFFPLTVDYREKVYAAGKFPGGFIKREGRPTTKEILTSRLIDRPIRPLFPATYFNEVQIMASTLSADR